VEERVRPDPAAADAPEPDEPVRPDAADGETPLALPLPPAPPDERGYAPGDVARLVAFLAGSPDAGQLAGFTLARTADAGQGYHARAVDAVRQAWLDELARRREP
jgi:hypothetical protein